jgi:hypothetical protein
MIEIPVQSLQKMCKKSYDVFRKIRSFLRQSEFCKKESSAGSLLSNFMLHGDDFFRLSPYAMHFMAPIQGSSIFALRDESLLTDFCDWESGMVLELYGGQSQ